jgi:hypothetical protein
MEDSMKTARLSRIGALASFSVLALMLLMSSVAFAQTGTSSLRGTITDFEGKRSFRSSGHHHQRAEELYANANY